jgi:hypothetical protein
MLTAFVTAIIVGAISAISFSIKQGHESKFLQILNTMGPASARQFLDSKIRPATKIGANQLIEQRRRMAGLSLLGDAVAIEQEIGSHFGGIHVIAQVSSVGLLGLAVRAPDPTPYIQRLEALATQLETEASGIYRLPKQQTRRLAILAGGLAGRPMPLDVPAGIFAVARQLGPLTALLYQQALAIALERTGNTPKAAEMYATVRARTNAFDRPLQGVA